ncbi:unnamed protein product [Urochloa decumbens]|uniref:Uncharacterized protein n=1 Tax=Urochloa decumbens TaxID=240449 RepID=A0ABC9B0J3_9POAL
MEQAAAWGRPCEFQLASWSSVEEPNAHAYWPPAGLPPVVEYAPTDIFAPRLSYDTTTTTTTAAAAAAGSVQLPLPLQSLGQEQQQQLALYNYHYSAPTLHGDQSGAAAQQEPSNDDAMRVFEAVTHAFEGDAQLMKLKMHRFPPNITRALGESYTVPRVVAIGPYHHGRQELVMAEKVKHVAAYHCIRDSGRTVREMYDAVVSVADRAHVLYDKDVVARISYDDFRHMMFFDACFLEQFMLGLADDCDPNLYDFFGSNLNDILHDVMLLENQIPWRAVEIVMDFVKPPVSLGKLIGYWRGHLQDRIVFEEPVVVDLDPNYKPPHFLDFIRFLMLTLPMGDKDKIKAVSTSVSAIELAEMGINLKANQATELAHMGLVNRKGAFFPELSMAPLSLDNTHASWLVNMAAFVLCTTPDFLDEDAEKEDSAACSYLLLLCMLLHREEDVHQLRTKGILQGAGLTNKEVLRFFTSLHNCLGLGSCYGLVMLQIESYRIRRWVWIKVYAFVCRNWKTIVGVGSAIGAFASILKTLKSLKGHN